MTQGLPDTLSEYCADMARRAAAASRQLALLSGEAKNQWLLESAAAIRSRVHLIEEANRLDIEAAPQFGLTDAQIDRLKLTTARIEGIARSLEEVAALGDPVGETMASMVRPNGLEIAQVRVPLGVVFFIYESRPNVTAEAAAICLKSENSVILRGGKEARHSSQAIVEILRAQACRGGIPMDAVQLVGTADRAAVGHFLSLDQYIDVVIPRGGEGLIRRVALEARMPVIKHDHGNCHVYVDASADLEMACQIVINAKCQRMGVCNACESLLVHDDVAPVFLPMVASQLKQAGVEIRGDQRTRALIDGAVPASEEDYFKEYLGPTISVKTVASIDDAIEHINHYGSHHTDAIITRTLASARRFAALIDSSAVMVNASTRFNDGGQFGLGAEIGISTDKFHARGPCGLRELTTYKYVVYGDGQVRT